MIYHLNINPKKEQELLSHPLHVSTKVTIQHWRQEERPARILLQILTPQRLWSRYHPTPMSLLLEKQSVPGGGVATVGYAVGGIVGA